MKIPQIESGLYEETLATLVRKPTFDPCAGDVKDRTSQAGTRQGRAGTSSGKVMRRELKTLDD